MKKLLSIFALAFLLVACSESEKITKCQLEESPIRINYTYVSQGDKIIQIEFDQAVDLKAAGIDDVTAEIMGDEIKALYSADGIAYESELKGELLFENIIIDMSKVKIADLIKLGIATGAPDTTVLSLDETLKLIKALGAVCE